MPLERGLSGMEPDAVGEVGPVRVQWTRRRQSRRGPDVAVPASAALRFVADLVRAGVNPRSRDIAGMVLEPPPGNDQWEQGTYDFSPVIRPPFLSGIMSESMRKPILSVFPPYASRRGRNRR